MITEPWPVDHFQLDLGDRMPNISGPDQEGRVFSILNAAPGPFAILSVPLGQEMTADAALQAFDRVVRDGQRARINAVVAMSGSVEAVHGKARALALGTPILADTQDQLAKPFRARRNGAAGGGQARDGIIAIVTDPDQTIRAVVAFTAPEAFAADLAAALSQVEQPGERSDAQHFAPVLRVPGLLNAEQCRALIEAWETSHRPGTVGTTGLHGEVADRRSEERVCYDHPLQGSPLKDRLLATITPRLREALGKAFQFPVQFYGGIMVVGYLASEGGYFRHHRDNSNPAHMHRRFALTVNLNTGDYEGGGVWFPEYSDRVYDPAQGDGLVFSCSLLHEAKVVTRGTRFILSAFMWGDAEERLRQGVLRQASERQQRHLRGA